MAFGEESLRLHSEAKLVIRPSRGQLRASTRRYIASSGVTLTAALINIYVLVHLPGYPKGVPGVLLIIGGFLLVGGLLRALYLRNVSVFLRESDLEYRNSFGIARRFHRHQVAGIATRIVRFPNTREPQEIYVFFAKDHTGLFTLPGRFWDPLDIESLGRLIGGHPRARSKELSASELKKEFPGALTFVQRNNGLVALLLVLVVLSVGVILTDGVH